MPVVVAGNPPDERRPASGVEHLGLRLSAFAEPIPRRQVPPAARVPRLALRRDPGDGQGDQTGMAEPPGQVGGDAPASDEAVDPEQHPARRERDGNDDQGQGVPPRQVAQRRRVADGDRGEGNRVDQDQALPVTRADLGSTPEDPQEQDRDQDVGNTFGPLPAQLLARLGHVPPELRGVRLLLGSEVEPGVVQALGELRGKLPRGVRVQAQGRRPPERQLLGNLSLDRGIPADEHQGHRRHRPEPTGQGPLVGPGPPADRSGQNNHRRDQGDFGPGPEPQAAEHPATDRREPRLRPERRFAASERGDGEAQGQGVGQGFVADDVGEREQGEEEHRQVRRSFAEHPPGQMMQGPEQKHRRQRRNPLRRQSPGERAMTQNPGERRLDQRDRQRVKRVLIRTSDHVERGPRLELAGHPEELESILRRERRPGHPHAMQDRRQGGNRDQPPSARHPALPGRIGPSLRHLRTSPTPRRGPGRGPHYTGSPPWVNPIPPDRPIRTTTRGDRIEHAPKPTADRQLPQMVIVQRATGWGDRASRSRLGILLGGNPG